MNQLLLDKKYLQKERLLIKHDAFVTSNFLKLRDNRIKIPGRERYLYPMLILELLFNSDPNDIESIDIISFCHKPDVSRPWIKFTIPVNEEKLLLDMWNIMQIDDNSDPEAIGYYSWHYTDGFFFNVNSSNPVDFNLKILLKGKLKMNSHEK